MHIGRGAYVGGRTWLLWRTRTWLDRSDVVFEATDRLVAEVARDARLKYPKDAFTLLCKLHRHLR